MIRVLHGDCLAILPTLEAESVHAVVTDPPYHLTSIVKRFGKTSQADDTLTSDRVRRGADGMARLSRGFMGQTWDGGDIAARPETWAAVLRVMRPGAHLVAFGGTRTWHRMACAIEDAGFEIRDTIMWLTGQGFPKSRNISAATDRCLCHTSMIHTENVTSQDEPSGSSWTGADDLRCVRQGEIQAESLDQAQCRELLQLPLSQHNLRGQMSDDREAGPFRMDDGIPGIREPQDERRAQPGMERRSHASEAARELRERPLCEVSARVGEHGQEGRLCDGASPDNGEVDWASVDADGMCASSGPRSSEQRARQSRIVAVQSDAQTGGAWTRCERCGKPRIPDGLGTALKPAVEPIILARKPLRGTVAANVLAHGCGALNIDAARIPGVKPDTTRGAGGQNGCFSPIGAQGRIEDDGMGRWPANLAHDGSAEVERAFAEFGESKSTGGRIGNAGGGNVLNVPVGKFCKGDPGFGDTGSPSRFFFCGKATAEDRAGSRHPTIKPLALMDWLVKMVAPPGGTVLDPFAGSGTTLLAADRLQMNAIGIEQDATSIADIHRRLAEDAPLFAEASPDQPQAQGSLLLDAAE